ncbi:uncharacterized protein LOC131016461 [Salvia miltiorrhiza]|uniref:uncharacterized protein LOC131016461 n=1 Tax=Salvia miltiorrhiza TaxID=226208 RepID=UPI0025AC0FB4|nr:uncharacterized protein LOC131016461 [Salvia miltiorrhiza]
MIRPSSTRFNTPLQSQIQSEKMEKGMTEITDLVFSQQNKEREEKEEKSVDAKESAEEENHSGDDSTSPEAKNGGVFGNFISGILHPSGGGDEREGSAAVDEREGSAASDGGGGLIDNIASHLPAPLSDDAAPATEEASILIHSIIHD